MDTDQTTELTTLTPDAHALDDELIRATLSAAVLEKVITSGDLTALTSRERLLYYKAVCDSVGLNPLTKPFDYLELSGQGNKKRLVLYPNKTCAEQLRERNGISITAMRSEVVEDIYLVHIHGADKNGRTDEATGAVPLVQEDGEWKETSGGRNYFQKTGSLSALSPIEKANAMMKAESKGKRRLTLSLAGLGLSPLHRAVAVDIEDLPALTAVPVSALPPIAATPAPASSERNYKPLFVALGKQKIADAQLRTYLKARFPRLAEQDSPSTKALTDDEFEAVLAEVDNGAVTQFLAMPEGKEVAA